MATSVKLDEALIHRVRHLAEARRRSAHWIMCEAIQQYVEREEARESFTQEALSSWTEYQETGLHLTGEETRRWLGSWGAGTDSERPDCHE